MNELEPVSFRRLLDRILEPAKQHFRHMFLPIAVPIAACGILASVLQVGWFRALTGGGDLVDAVPMIGGFFLLLIVILALYGLGFGALLVGSLDAVASRSVAMGRAWLFVLKPRVFGTLIVVAVLNLLSFMMCLFPALYVTPILTFTLPVMLEEGRFGWAAIRRSVQLAHYNPSRRWIDSTWLKIVVLLATGLVISYAVSLTVQMPFLIAQQVLVFREAAGGQLTDPASILAATLWLQIPAQILRACATATTWLYFTFGITLLYREIRRLREGDDLRQAIEALTGGGPSGAIDAAT